MIAPVLPEGIERYLKTYLHPAPVQEPEESGTDPQLSSLITSILEQMQRLGESGVLLDIGCGKGTLLHRLLEAGFSAKSGWVYVAVDTDENLDSIQKIAREAAIARRVEPVQLDKFYTVWPQIGTPQLVFCRNVLHELTISQTAQLLSHVALNLHENDVFFCQDLMNFPQGERHNACWFPGELESCLRDHGFRNITTVPIKSRSGACWFNMIVYGAPIANLALPNVDWQKSVLEARQQQWNIWSNIDSSSVRDGSDYSEVILILDLDLQLAALTRQLRDAGAFVTLDASSEKRLRSREIYKVIETFVNANQLEKPIVTERVRLRERGEQLNALEDFLRSDEALAVINGGRGTGKTCLAEHLLATRSYEKSTIILDAKQASDLWSFAECMFAQIGLRLDPERLSVLQNLNWSALEIPIRQFANRFSKRIIIFIDNFDALVDTNGVIQDKELALMLSVLVGADGAKMICTQRGTQLPEQLIRASKNLNPPTIRVGRYATEQTVINILDDRFDRASARLDTYPPRLIQAIDRHPLAAMLASEILNKHGPQVLMNDRFFMELEQHLHRELWNRLVDDHSIEAVQMASELRIPVPRSMLEKLSAPEAVSAGLASTALYVVKDHRWEALISLLALFRRRHIDDTEDKSEEKEKEKHQSIADKYLSTYQHDDDPKWIRESYFHRMLAADDDNYAQLGQYYFKELISSANYCFTKRDYRTALELYNAALKNNKLNEDAQMHRASCQIRLGDSPAGEIEYERLINAYPDNNGIRTSFVDALLFIRNFAKAKQKLIDYDLNPERNDWITGQWGRVWLGLNEYSKAEEMFRKQLAANPLANPEVFTNLSRALQNQGAVSEALSILKRGFGLHPDDFRVVIAYGACLERLRNYDDALSHLEPLFQARPDRTDAAITLIKIFSRRNGGNEKARQVFERAKKNAPSTSDSLLITAEAELLKAENRHEVAIQLLRKQMTVDQHYLGMLLECYFHFAQSQLEPSERIRIAQEALTEAVPFEIQNNVPLAINRCRLAALAGDRDLFDSLLASIKVTRVEQFEIDSLESLWIRSV